MPKTKEIHKESWHKTILTHGKWYMLSSLLTKGINILVLRVYTEYLNPSEYGILDTLNSIALFLPFFISLYLDSAFARFYHEYKSDLKKLEQLFSSIFIFVFFFGSFVTVLVLWFSKYWLNDFLEIPLYPYIYLAFIPPLFHQLGSLGLVFLRQSLRSKETVLVEIGSILVNLIIALPLLIVFDFGILAKLWGNFSASLALFLFYLIFFIRKGLLKLTFSKTLLRESLIYSIPLMPAFLGSWLAGLSDRLVIAKYTGVEQVGYYAVGLILGKILYMVHDAITQVIGPISISGLIDDNQRTKQKMGTISLIIWTYMLLLNLMLYVFSKELILIFANKAYSNAAFIVPIIGFSYVLGSQSRIFSSIIMYHKKNWIFSSGGIIQGLLNLLLNLLFIPIFGYIFAAYSTVISVLFFTLWILYWSFKIDKFPFNAKKYIISLTLFVLAICTFYLLNIETLLYKTIYLIPIIMVTNFYYPIKKLLN